jgi:hypothetical protein
MYFLNLSLVQFLAVFGSVSAIAVTLYLLDRSWLKLVVSTLRFWEAAAAPSATARRRRIHQPWSLILQLVSMALLVLAIAQLRLGAPVQGGRDHVLILDTSAWMGARLGKGILMDTARQSARQYVRALPARDRVMLVRADALVTPATAFEPDRRRVEAAIQASEPGLTALNLDQALAFARHIQMQEGRLAGEIAYVGAGRISETESTGAPPPNLRVIPIPDPVENCGLRKIGVRRSAADRDVWEIYISTHNYGTVRRKLTLVLDFGPADGPARATVGSRPLNIPAGGDADASFEYRTGAGGILGATLVPHDAFPRDDHAELELPPQPSLAVTVYSNQPNLLRPVLAAMPRVAAVYRKPEEYRADASGLVILDRFIPPQRPVADSVWIDPPANGSPIPIRRIVSNVPFEKWGSDHPITQGLRAKDFKLDRASIFEAAADDTRIGEVADGPVIVARGRAPGAPPPGQPKIVVFGFHPALSGMRYELVTPLLFANLMRWVAPDIFYRSEISGGSVGTVKLVLDQETGAPAGPRDVKITAENGSPVPFTLRDRTLNFFAGSPGTVRVLAGDREYLYSLTLPQLWDAEWTAPAGVRHGIPRFARVFDGSSDLWPWLTVAGVAGLFAEWLLFGSAWRSRGGRDARRVAGPFLLRRRRPVEAGR